MSVCVCGRQRDAAHRDKKDKSHLPGGINLGLEAKGLIDQVTRHHTSLVPSGMSLEPLCSLVRSQKPL